MRWAAVVSGDHYALRSAVFVRAQAYLFSNPFRSRNQISLDRPIRRWGESDPEVQAILRGQGSACFRLGLGDVAASTSTDQCSKFLQTKVKSKVDLVAYA